MNHFRLLCSVGLLIVLSACSQISPADRSNLRKVVVCLSMEEPQMTRFKTGLTAFTHESAAAVPLTGFKPEMLGVIRAELEKRFPQSVLIDQELKVEMDVWVGKVKPNAEAVALAAKHGADAVLWLFIGGHTPYGVPPGIVERGFGAWYGPNIASSGATVGTYTNLRLLQKSDGREYASGSAAGGGVVPGVRFEPDFSSYSPEQQKAHRSACLTALKQSLERSFLEMGLPARP